MAKRTASAVWEGTLREGNGRVKLGSGAFEGQYSFASRFEEGTGTNPEELIGAAHAGCFSMALSNQLGTAGLKPERIATEATVTLEKLESGFAITQVHLQTTARVPGASAEAFRQAAENAKSGCPVSKLLNAKITLDAKLEESRAAD